MGTRDNPKPSRCLGVFGLSVYTTEDELYHIMSKYGPVERVQVVIDAKVRFSIIWMRTVVFEYELWEILLFFIQSWFFQRSYFFSMLAFVMFYLI